MDQLVDDLWADDLPENPSAALRIIVSRARKVLGSAAAVPLRARGLPARRRRSRRRALRRPRRRRTPAPRGRTVGASRGPPARRPLAVAWRCARRRALRPVRRDRKRRASISNDLRSSSSGWPQTWRAVAITTCISELAGLVAEHPLQEGLWAQRMLALYRAGRQADALRAYAEVRDILAEQLGLDPGPELRALEDAILQQRQRPRPAGAHGSPGWRRRSAPSRRRGRRSSGVRPSSNRCRGWFATRRVVSLVGPAGVGKTRLAVEAAATLGRSAGVEVQLVELATVTDPASVGDEIATRIGAPSLRQGDALRSVASRLHGRPGAAAAGQLRAAARRRRRRRRDPPRRLPAARRARHQSDPAVGRR